MKIALSVWSLLLLVGCPSATQIARASGQLSPPNETVLEVAAVDFDVAWEQKYLYLQVLADGTMECQIANRKSGEKRFEPAEIVPVKRTLSESELKQLRGLLAEPEVSRLQKTYRQRIAMMLDAGTSWNIRIPRANQTQEVHVVAFAPDVAKSQKHPYPKALLALGCTIEKLRAETIGQKVEAEGECTNIPSSR